MMAFVQQFPSYMTIPDFEKTVLMRQKNYSQTLLHLTRLSLADQRPGQPIRKRLRQMTARLRRPLRLYRFELHLIRKLVGIYDADGQWWVYDEALGYLFYDFNPVADPYGGDGADRPPTELKYSFP